VGLPLRVMLRSNEGFGATEEEVALLCYEAAALRREGADQFVFGFLDGADRLDRGAIEALTAAVAPCPWTLHHAFDHATDMRREWEKALTLPGIDCVLSGGIRGDLSVGLELLCGRVGWQTERVRWLAGGGIMLDYVASLRAAGIERYHVGRAARFGQDWARPVSEAAVRHWREVLDGGGDGA
jgi:copper homeostasis protein